MERSILLNGNRKWSKMDWYRPFPYAVEFLCAFSYAQGKHFSITKCMEKKEARRTKRVTVSSPVDDEWPACIIENTRHRDGSIYKRNYGLLSLCRITDRHESKRSKSLSVGCKVFLIELLIRYAIFFWNGLIYSECSRVRYFSRKLCFTLDARGEAMNNKSHE